MGHKKVNCLKLTRGAVAVPVPATLRITDGHKGKATTPVVKSMAFQLTVVQTRTTPDVVIGMFSIYYSLSLLFMLIFHVMMFRDVLSEQITCSSSF